MIITSRQKTREVRKLNILAEFTEGTKFYTNQIANRIGVVWPVADLLLKELVEEGKLSGDKLLGYKTHQESGFWGRIKYAFHI